jgi:hypothetical protein
MPYAARVTNFQLDWCQGCFQTIWWPACEASSGGFPLKLISSEFWSKLISIFDAIIESYQNFDFDFDNHRIEIPISNWIRTFASFQGKFFQIYTLTLVTKCIYQKIFQVKKKHRNLRLLAFFSVKTQKNLWQAHFIKIDATYSTQHIFNNIYSTLHFETVASIQYAWAIYCIGKLLLNLLVPNGNSFVPMVGGGALKGQCHEIFDPRFFSANNPP